MDLCSSEKTFYRKCSGDMTPCPVQNELLDLSKAKVFISGASLSLKKFKKLAHLNFDRSKLGCFQWVICLPNFDSCCEVGVDDGSHKKIQRNMFE